MLSRTTTIVNSTLISVLVVPLVWLIGYQDHQWRNSRLAALAALLLIGASLSLKVAAPREDPPVSRGWPLAALTTSSFGLLLALAWKVFG